MKILVILLIAILLFATVSVSGCLSTGSTIKNQQEAGEAIKDVSTDVGEVTDTLQEIEQTLG